MPPHRREPAPADASAGAARPLTARRVRVRPQVGPRLAAPSHRHPHRPRSPPRDPCTPPRGGGVRSRNGARGRGSPPRPPGRPASGHMKHLLELLPAEVGQLSQLRPAPSRAARAVQLAPQSPAPRPPRYRSQPRRCSTPRRAAPRGSGSPGPCAEAPGPCRTTIEAAVRRDLALHVRRMFGALQNRCHRPQHSTSHSDYACRGRRLW